MLELQYDVCGVICLTALTSFLKFAWRYKVMERPKWTWWDLKPFRINYSCLILDSESWLGWVRGFNSHPVHFYLRGNYGIKISSFWLIVGQNPLAMPWISQTKGSFTKCLRSRLYITSYSMPVRLISVKLTRECKSLYWLCLQINFLTTSDFFAE